jgi:hypothetical protein
MECQPRTTRPASAESGGRLRQTTLLGIAENPVDEQPLREAVEARPNCEKQRLTD